MSAPAVPTLDLKIVQHEFRLGYKLTGPEDINVPIFVGTDNPQLVVRPIPEVPAGQKIIRCWWQAITPTYQLKNFRWLDVKPDPSPDDVQLLVLLQDSPPPPAEGFDLKIRVYCVLGPRID